MFSCRRPTIQLWCRTSESCPQGFFRQSIAKDTPCRDSPSPMHHSLVESPVPLSDQDSPELQSPWPGDDHAMAIDILKGSGMGGVTDICRTSGGTR